MCGEGTGMSKPSDRLIPVLNTVFDAEEGSLDDSGIADLKSLLYGVFGKSANNTKLVMAIEQGDWRYVEGRLQMVMAEIDASANSPSVNVKTLAEASANASVSISAFLEVQETISKSSELDQQQIDQLVVLLQQAIEAAQENRPKTVGAKLKEFFEVGANTVTVAQVIGPLLLQLGRILVNQVPVTMV